MRDVGCALTATGLQRGEPVAILSENCPEWLYADLGAQCVGCVPVGIDVSEPAERVADILNECEARILFVDNEEQFDTALAASANTPALEWVVAFDERVSRAEAKVRIASFAAFCADGRQFQERDPERWDNEIGRAAPDETTIIVCDSRASPWNFWSSPLPRSRMLIRCLESSGGGA